MALCTVASQAAGSRNSGSVLAERAAAACAASAAAWTAIGARGHRWCTGRAFGDRSRASTDEAMDVATAIGAMFDRVVGHFLAFLEAGCAGVAEVFVSRHMFFSQVPL